MASDNTVVHIGENSPEQVAYKLMHDVFAHENHQKLTREIILDTYAECLRTVRVPNRSK
jgi:hypothetical protein